MVILLCISVNMVVLAYLARCIYTLAVLFTAHRVSPIDWHRGEMPYSWFALILHELSFIQMPLHKSKVRAFG